jgi:hypothetical protein
MRRLWGCIVATLFALGTAHAQAPILLREDLSPGAQKADTPTSSKQTPAVPPDQEPYNNVWGLDILISNDGFGLGTFYRRLFTPDLSGVISLSVSESKDEREVEQYDPYYQVSYVPGKLNRFLVMPLLIGVQYRLFREDIVETFRPYVNAGAGPAMIYQMPFVEFVPNAFGGTDAQQVDFFKSIGRGHPHWTISGFIGFGANFGTDGSNVFGVNFRYYFTNLYSGGLPSLYNLNTFGVAGTKSDFGGFFITLNVGMGY